MAQTEIKLVINDVEFKEIPNDKFIVYGEEDKLPFLDNFYFIFFPNPHRAYKSIVINGKYYAPIIK